VLTYDNDRQGQLFRNAEESAQNLHQSLETRRNRLMANAQVMVGLRLQVLRQTIATGGIWMYGAFVLIAALGYKMRHEIRNRWWLFRLRRTGRVDGRIIDALFFRAVRLAGRKNAHRKNSQTWREWISTINHDQRRSALRRALEVFEKSK